MTFNVKMTITGLQEAQARNNRRIAALQPSGEFGRAILYATTEVHRYAVGVTHVDTGSLRASHRMEVSGIRGMVYLDPGAANPRSGQRTAVYGPHEHARGGSHAFYQRTISEAGAGIMQRSLGMVRLELQK